MSDLTTVEKNLIENLFGMKSGYVLEFSNDSFQEFFFESVGVDIYDDRYNYSSGSKANRLRAFFKRESNHLVGKVISDLMEIWRTNHITNEEETSEHERILYGECVKIVDRLKTDEPVDGIDALSQISAEKDINKLVKLIRETIRKNEPETALDRLHTLVVKYVRQLCKKHGIDYNKNKPLHSLLGEYVKYLKKVNLLESQMTERILKSNLSVLESFNTVRNQQSLAHDNPLLNYDESTLIANNIINLIKFISSIEDKLDTSSKANITDEIDDLPF